jgi:IS1 family transposase
MPAQDKGDVAVIRRLLPPILLLLVLGPLLAACGQRAVCYSDFLDAYACVLPSKRHRPVGKDSGQTSRIERLNNTLRQRISRLVRKPLSFSKKRENHIGAIWYFVHHYHASLA